MGRPQPRQKAGQAVVLVAIAVLFLAAILALALDGGTIYLDRRQLQNAADAAALAAAEGLQLLPPSYTSAHNQAMTTLVKNLPGTTVPAGFAPTPAQLTVGPVSIGANYTATLSVATTATYQVTISHVRPVAVAPIHGFASTITLQTSATAQNGNLPFAVVTVQDTDPNYADVQVASTATLTVSGGASGDRGGVFSNAFINLAGMLAFSPSCGSGGAGDLWVFTPGAAVAGHLTNCSTSPYPLAARKIAYPSYPEPPPPSFTAVSGANVPAAQTAYLCPGRYRAQISVTGTAVLLPGVFQIREGGIDVTGSLRTLQASDFAGGPIPGGSTNCSQAVAAMPADPGVILEVTPQLGSGATLCRQAQVTTHPGSSLTLVASPKFFNMNLFIETLPSWQTCPIPGGTGVVNLTGGGYYSIPGAIYGPYDNMKFVPGTAGSGLGQVIAWTAAFSGSGSVTATFAPNSVPFIKGLI